MHRRHVTTIRHISTTLTGLALLVMSVPAAAGPADAQPHAYVADSQAHVVSVLDTATESVVGTIAVGTAPSGVAITRDGTRAYVTNTGSDSVSVLDIATNSVVATIAVGPSPSAVAVTPNAARLYVVVAGGSVAVIDTELAGVIATIPVGTSLFGGGSGVAITPDGRRAYVVAQAVLAVIDTATNTVVSHPDVGPSPAAVAISPDGRRAYVTNAWGFDTFAGSIVVIDTATGAVIDTIVYGAVLMSIAVTPDGSRAYAASPSQFVSTGYGSAFIPSRWVGVFDLVGGTVWTSILLAGPPSAVAVTPDGSHAYVTIPSANSVAVIDTANNTVVGSIGVPAGPSGLAIAPDAEPSPPIPASKIHVSIDIKPGSPNNVSPRSKSEVIPVAILSSDSFDARTVDPATVRFGATGTEAAPVEVIVKDVNRDRRADLLLRFKTRDTGIACGATVAVLTGHTFGGPAIEGSGWIHTLGCK